MSAGPPNPCAERRPGAGAAALLAVLALLGGCGLKLGRAPPPPLSAQVPDAQDAVPRSEPLSRYGNPESYVVFGRTYYPLKSARGFVERGIASWYGPDFHGKRTSSGEPYDMYRMTAAHKTLPLPTYVQVTNLQNGRKTVLRVNDRGPFHENRVIDLSFAAAKKLGVDGPGTALVEVRALEPGAPLPASVPPPAGPALAGEAETTFWLQVGAFRDRANAERLRDRLNGTVERAVDIAQATVDGTPIYRVRVGPLVSVDVADRVVEALVHLGLHEHTVVFD